MMAGSRCRRLPEPGSHAAVRVIGEAARRVAVAASAGGCGMAGGAAGRAQTGAARRATRR